MRTRTQIYLAGAALAVAGLFVFPVVLYRARRPRPRPYREEVRERNRLAVVLGAEAEGTEYPAAWGPRRVA
jgi:hypothetical protein